MDHFQYKNSVLHAEEVNLAQLASSVDTPFYCYSTATLERHYKVFAESFAEHNPKICYALKANSNLAVVKTLAALGAGADVVSQGEIRIARTAGVPAEKIVFSGVGKTRQEMDFALEQNIFQFNVESEPELLALNEVAQSKNLRARVALRVNPDVVPHTHAKISTGQKESKFGIPYALAPAMFNKAKTLQHIDARGVSIHIGSQLTKLEPFQQAFMRVRELVQQLRAQGHIIKTVDLGGGLGIPYGREAPPLPAAYATIAKKAVAGLECELIFEPGRMLVGNAGILVSRVIYVKRGEERNFLILDAGMNDLIRPSLYEAYHEIVPVQETNAKKELFDVVGPVCETGDIFAERRELPALQPDDLVAFRSAGAYGAVMASTYNARPLVPEVMVKGVEYAIIRPRPTYQEMLGQDRLPEWIS